MSLVTVTSDYIIKADTVYQNLKDAEETFAREVSIISYMKCLLARTGELSSFTVDGIHVDVYSSGKGYDLYFEGYVMSLEVYDRQIIDYHLYRN